jgi:cell division protein FtsX
MMNRIRKKKYRGIDPFKKMMNDQKNVEKLYKIYYIINIWVWFAMLLGSIIFIIWAVKYLGSIN